MIVDSHNTLAELRHNDFPKRVLEDNSSGLSYTMRLSRVVCAKITAELVAFTTEACEEINFMVGVTLCENKRCARPNSPRFTKDDFAPLGARCTISSIWKTATVLPRIAAEKTDAPCKYCSTKST